MVKIKPNRDELYKLRILQGMSCADLALKVGVTRQCIATIERGLSNPSPSTAKKISEILNVPFDDIFSMVEGD